MSVARRKRIVVLISGRGSNMKAVIEACRKDSYPATVVAVISDRRQAAGLTVARNMGVPIRIADFAACDSVAHFYDILLRSLRSCAPDLVVLAGFMRILPPFFIDKFRDRMLNIHPSLLPNFKGLYTHRRAIESGSRKHGCSVHFVNEQIDAGKVILQAEVTVSPGDDERSLAQKVLIKEHQIYPQAIAMVCAQHQLLR